MTAAEAHTAAATEGLALLRSAENAAGFLGVRRKNNSVIKPFTAKLKKQQLGSFATAEEAALAYARALGPDGVSVALGRNR